MSEQQLAVREAAAIVRHGFDDETRALIRKTVSDARNPLTSDEFELFIAVCQHIGANPLLREAYALKDRNGRFSIAIGIDKFRQQTQADPRFIGQAGPYWAGRDGVWKDVWLEDAPPAAARVGIWLRGAREPTWGVATYKACHRNTPQWNDNPAHMLAIRAEAHAHRKCSSRLSGPVVLREDDGDERPDWVDSDGVIDEAHPSRARAIAAGIDDAIAEAEASVRLDGETQVLAPDPELDAADELVREIEEEAGTAEQPPVSEATRLACAAFVDEVMAANPKLRVALPPDADGDVAWRRWLLENQTKWRTSPHNPAAARTAPGQQKGA